MNKRGFELALNTIVLLVLAMLVLLFGILFFTKGSESFSDTITSYFSYSNVDSVVQRCNILADSNSVNGFCCEKIEIKYYSDDKKAQGQFSCNELIDKSFVNNKINPVDCKEINC